MILHLPLSRGVCVAPWLILIPNWAKGHRAYLAHEKVHADQQRRLGTLSFWYRYLTDKSFRLTAELEAFKVQIEHGADVEYCVNELVTGYGLGVTHEQMRRHFG